MRRIALALGIALCAGTATTSLGVPAAQAAGAVLHVATTGSSGGSGTAASPLRSVQDAVDRAGPGSSILVHRGTYPGQVRIRTSGTAAAPITLTNAGDGAVTLTSSPATVSCASRQPASERTIMIGGGADFWTIRGLTVVNGVHVFGEQGNAAYQWFTDRVRSHDWRSRRAAPGRGTNDPAAARGIVSYLRTQTGADLDRSDGIVLADNTITRRGIHAAFSGNGRITGNTIRDIDCGTGPAVWLITYSDGWDVSGNSISDVARSTAAHFMQEGIRLGSASNYNVVRDNVIQDLPGDGRAYNTDVDSSYNVFENNVARRVGTGYNDQMSGWGNTWRYNSVEDFRDHGFSFRLMDGPLVRPSEDTSTKGATVRCNTASGTGRALGVGGIRASTFSGNGFASSAVSSNARAYWGAEGNRYNGSTTAPGPTMTPVRAGC